MNNKKKLAYVLLPSIIIIILTLILYIFYPRTLENTLDFKINFNNNISMKIVKTNYFEDVSSINYSQEYETNDTKLIKNLMEHLNSLKVVRTFDKLNKPAEHSDFGYYILIADTDENRLLTIFRLDQRNLIFNSSKGIRKYKFKSKSIDIDFIDSLIE